MTDKHLTSSKTSTINRQLPKTGYQIKAVLFDFDGTLTLPGALDFPAIKESIGCPLNMAILEYIDTIADTSEKNRLNRILDQAEEAAAQHSIPNDGAEEILDWLKLKGVLIGIITRNALAPVAKALENFSRFTLNDFDVVISREAPVKPKPSPEGVNLAMERLHVRNDETLMVGDYLFDMSAGNGAGVSTILIPAAGEQRDVTGWEQDLQITQLEELKTIVEYHLPLPPGKLPNRFLDRFLASLEISDPSVLITPGVGEDTTAINIGAEEVLILKSDPITFVSESAARYAVTINANDIATSGATPRWFLSTLLFPPGTTPAEILATMTELQTFCKQQQITLCGGHTEITDAVTRPVISGMVAGTVTRNRLVDKKQMAEGDRILLTKAISIEGTTILAQEFEKDLLASGITPEEIEKAKALQEQISISQEASVAMECGGISAMHDVTEGGLATALDEMSLAGGHRLSIHVDQIPVHDLARRMCSVLNLNPLGLIGSGSLLVCARIDSAERLLSALADAGIQATVIGEVLGTGSGIEAFSSGTPTEWPTFETDELARLYG